MNKIKRLAPIVLLIFAASKVNAQAAQDTSLSGAWVVTKKMLSKFSTRVPNVGGTFAIVENGNIVGQYNFGFADREKKIKVNNQTLFPMGSVSKLITAIAIVQLQERGKLSLNDPVTKYIPELKKAPKDFGGFDSVKIHHLINHTTHYDRGVALYRQFEKENPHFKGKESFCFDDLKPYFHLFKFTGKPGTKFMYSNWGYSFLGVIVERISGMKYKHYVHQKILKPLKMIHSYFGATTKKRKKYFANGYVADSNGVISQGSQPVYDQCFGEANGGLKSNAEDMLKLMNFFSGTGSKAEKINHSKVLKSKTIRENFTLNAQNIKAPTKFVYQFNYKTYKTGKISGLTFMNFGNMSKSYLGHGGYLKGYKTAFFWRNNKKIGLIWMINAIGHKYSDEYYLDYILKTLQNQLLLKLSVNDRTWEDYHKMYDPKRK